ncbi:MAG TPA: TonB-dependent receptor, partial [Variovorax sp.]|nr:TonB-dependent receptor [Variovorax sp.]
AVTVSAEAPGTTQNLGAKASGGALGNRTQLDTPFSTTVVTQEELEERQVNKLGDVFALDASVTDNSGAYSSWASYITVRGLPLDWQNGYRIDGKPFLSYAITLPYEHFEQIDLLKGASGFMYGFGTPGGIVNYASKKPTEQPLRSVGVGYLSNNVWSEQIDLGGRFGEGERFGYRFNAVHEEGDTFNEGGIRRDSASLSLDARLTRELSWTFDALYQKRKTTDQTPSIFTGSYTGSTLPPTVRGDDQTLVGPGQHLDTQLQMYSTGLAYQLSPDWKLRTDYSYSKSDRSRNEGILYLADPSGDYNDLRSDSAEGHRFNQWQAMAEGQLRTGGIGHLLTLGVSWQQQVNRYSSNAVYQPIGTGNLFQPNTNAYFSQTDFAMYRNSDIVQRALFASDTLKFSEQWSLLAGLRATNYEQTSYGTDGAVTSEYAKDGVVTPTLALMFHPRPDTMLYGSYVESLEPGSIVGSNFVNEGELLKPLKSKQYELGAKTQRDGWSASAALFRIERGAEFTNSANVLVQDGMSIYQGVELGSTMRLGRQWQIGANLMWLDSSYDQGTANIGNRVSGAPSFVATAQVTYAVAQLPGLKFFADAKYTGGTMLNATNQLKLDSYTIGNVGASYATRIGGLDTVFRLALNNVTDERYWEFQYDNYLKPGDPRTLAVSAKLNF